MIASLFSWLKRPHATDSRPAHTPDPDFERKMRNTRTFSRQQSEAALEGIRAKRAMRTGNPFDEDIFGGPARPRKERPT